MSFKNKLFISLLSLFIIAAFATDGHCGAWAVSWYDTDNNIDWNVVATGANCWPPPVIFSAGFNPCFNMGVSPVFCMSSRTCGTPPVGPAWSGATAWAGAGFGWTWARVITWARPGTASGGRSVDSFFVAVDSVEAVIDTTATGFSVRLNGEISALPWLTSEVQIEVMDNVDTTASWGADKPVTGNTLFSGKIHLLGASIYGMETSGFSGIVLDTIGDTTRVTLVDLSSSEVSYSGPKGNLVIKIRGDASTFEPTPSLTPYGMIALLLILMITGFWIYRRRQAIHTEG